jgi:arginyl-tRNA synthetase
MNFKEELIKLLTKQTKLDKSMVNSLLDVPPNPKMGDYAFPCFKLGKNMAEKLKEKIKKPKFISQIEVVGPYLNFFLNKTVLARETLMQISKEKEAYGKGKKSKKIVLEYCGPNTNKPLHLGHIRNMALGNSMVRVLCFAGNQVSPVNIINDRGIHICQSMLAYKKWGKGKKPNKKGDHFVGDFYVMFAKKNKKNPDLMNQAQEMLFKWENEDKEVRKLWGKMNSWVLEGFSETYNRFGIKFDKEYHESRLYEKGKVVAFEGLKKQVFEKDDDKNIVANLEKFGLTNKVVLRADGTSVYITQDLFLAEQRYKDYKYDKSIYVVASEQNLHFKQLFKIIELLKRPFAGRLYHLGYGLVHLPSGRMKSREGTVIDADDIMDEISTLAGKEVEKRYPKLSGKEKIRRAEFIGLSALKFFMLKTDSVRDIVFNPEGSLKFEGETGPYLQYTHARACSVLRKANYVKGDLNYAKLKKPLEHDIVLRLSKFGDVVNDVAKQYKPHILCRYLLDLAQMFNEFYHGNKVISDDKVLMAVRLELVDSVRQVLGNGLGMLGIEAPMEM